MQISFWPSWMPKCKIQSIWAIYLTVIESSSKVQSPSWNRNRNLNPNPNPSVWLSVGGIVFLTHNSLNPIEKYLHGHVCLCPVNHGKSWLAKSFSQLIHTEPLAFDLAENALCGIFHQLHFACAKTDFIWLSVDFSNNFLGIKILNKYLRKLDWQ